MEQRNRLLRIPKRISRFKRKTEGEQITVSDVLAKPTLTQRDKDVLLGIYYHRCLTTHQIAEIFFKYDRKGNINSQAEGIARRRLRKLFDLQLIDRFFVEVPEGHGSSPQHVVLDKLGAQIVAGMMGVDITELEWKYEMNDVRLPYLSHMISINDFYVALLNHARQNGHKMLTFLVENHVRHDFTHKNRRIKFNPDAYGKYFINDNEGFHFFLELDNGTMTLQTFKQKVHRYNAYFEKGEYKAFYGASFPLILVVAPSETRAISLRNAVYAENHLGLRWLFTTKELAELNPLGAIWIGAGKNPVSLLD